MITDAIVHFVNQLRQSQLLSAEQLIVPNPKNPNGNSLFWAVGSNQDREFSWVNPAQGGKLPTPIQANKTYTTTLPVRRDSITALLDDKVLCACRARAGQRR
jgi:hypothetical protein